MSTDKNPGGRIAALAPHADHIIITLWAMAVTVVFLSLALAGDLTPKCWLWFCEMPIFYIPYWEYTAAMLKAGFMPVWAPQVHCGFPYVCFPGTNLYFPPFYLLMHLGYARSSCVEAWVCYGLGGAFAYRCFRRLGASPIAALAGLLATATSMYANFESSNFWGEREILAFPLCLWGIIGLARERARFRFWFALMIGTVILSFHPEALVYALMFFAVLTPVLARPAHRVRASVLAAGAIAAAALAVFAPFLCLYEYAGRSIRGPGLTYEYYLTNKFELQTYAGMFLPLPRIFHGIPSPWYLGWSVIWLAILGAKAKGKKAGPIIAAIAALTLLFINPWPVDFIMFHLPVINRLIQPYYYFPQLLFLVAALAVAGVSALLQNPGPPKTTWAPAAMLGAGLIFISFDTGHPIQAAILGLPAGLAIAAIIRPKILAARAPRAALIIVLIVGDLTVPSLFRHHFTPMKLFQVLPEAEELLKNSGRERFWLLSKDAFTNPNVNPNMGMRLDPFLPGTATPLSYWRLAPMRAAQVINLISPGYLEFKDGKLLAHRRENAMWEDAFAPNAPALLSLLNVGPIISQGIELNNFPRTPHQGELTLYENPNPLPRARAVARWTVAPPGGKALELMAAGTMDFAREAVVEDKSGYLESSDAPGPAPEVTVAVARPGYWDLNITRPPDEAKGKSQSLLVVSETLAPGWRAWVDGTEAPVRYAYHAFIGVIMPPDARRVELIFAPWSFRLGIWVSITSMLLWPIWILVKRMTKFPTLIDLKLNKKRESRST